MTDSSDNLAVAFSLFLFSYPSWLCSYYLKYIKSQSVSTTKNLHLWVDWASDQERANSASSPLRV